MILDSQTNYLNLADSLPEKYPDFYNRLMIVLSESGIKNSLLPGTKDIWAVDYMPIQVTDNVFIQFDYNPDYLQNEEDQRTISNVDNICKEVGIQTHKSDIRLDGGNVIKSSNKVVMCDKIFKENKNLKKAQLTEELKKLFEIEKLVFIPTDPSDIIGHADGMVRFIDDKTVLINNYSKEDNSLKLSLISSLKDSGLDWVEMPYNPYSNKTNFHANGIYMNFIQMEDVIIVPIFKIKEDEMAVKLFTDVFPNQTIKTIESNEIANDGGILNCISWNIKN